MSEYTKEQKVCPHCNVEVEVSTWPLKSHPHGGIRLQDCSCVLVEGKTHAKCECGKEIRFFGGVRNLRTNRRWAHMDGTGDRCATTKGLAHPADFPYLVEDPPPLPHAYNAEGHFLPHDQWGCPVEHKRSKTADGVVGFYCTYCHTSWPCQGAEENGAAEEVRKEVRADLSEEMTAIFAEHGITVPEGVNLFELVAKLSEVADGIQAYH